MENNKEQPNTIELRQSKEKKAMIEQLKKVPIIQIACERANLSRPTFYRWRSEDNQFAKEVKEALSEGITFINELSESQVISLIKEKNLPAIRLWLTNNHPKYAQRIEISTVQPQDKLDPEQEEVVRQALELAGLIRTEDKSLSINIERYDRTKEQSINKPDQSETTTPAPGNSGKDDEGHKSEEDCSK
jgi:hypothetical protein